jgi:hypothetical protein
MQAWNRLTLPAVIPRENCFGCCGSQAFPLAEACRAPGQDSIIL